MNKLIDVLAKYQKHLLGLAIFLAFSAVSITINKGKVELNLTDYPMLMILLVLVSLLLILIYIRIDNQRIALLSEQIKDQSTSNNNEFENQLLELTPRQREVYDLIISGKSNKAIMDTLFIEQSTLKSHINQLYKKLNIKSRKELKSKVSH